MARLLLLFFWLRLRRGRPLCKERLNNCRSGDARQSDCYPGLPIGGKIEGRCYACKRYNKATNLPNKITSEYCFGLVVGYFHLLLLGRYVCFCSLPFQILPVTRFVFCQLDQPLC